jgi:predicted amidophosphoribosyltransferase
MKGCGTKNRWKDFARLLLSLSTPMPDRTCLVAIPSKSGKADHATGLALAISEIMGFPLFNALKVVQSEESQRSKNRKQRQGIRFLKARPLRRRYTNIVLVDDVVTSGATLQAAYKALGEPISARALCFIDRGLVAEPPEDCYKGRQ